ncbi:MAG: glycosyltransferase [Ignavibacteria bacterium]|nr:glycosyltransferase [Ignavibacteria bacterium]
MKKKASVIIPTLNEEKLVERLLKQFNGDFRKKYEIELIVSDGGSDDNTIAICDRYADKVVTKDNNRSQNISQGRNEGARQSQGDVLIFLNADVTIDDPDHLISKSVEAIREKKCSAIACRVEVHEAERKFSDVLFHGFYNRYVSFLNKVYIGMGRGECHIMSREAFDKAGGYNEKLAAGEDFDLYNRLRKTGKVEYRNDFLVYESPRRYRKYGYARIILDWNKNAYSVFFLNRSISKSWDPVR